MASQRLRREGPTMCPGLKTQDDGQATKTHAEVAVGRSDDPRCIADHHRGRRVDGDRGGIGAYARVGVPAVTQRALRLLQHHESPLTIRQRLKAHPICEQSNN